jgi:hypothetical protein
MDYGYIYPFEKQGNLFFGGGGGDGTAKRKTYLRRCMGGRGDFFLFLLSFHKLSSFL